MSWNDWVRGSAEIEPSLYAADFAALGAEIERVLDAGARILHFDTGDGHFVEPVTIGPIVLRSIAPLVHERGGVLDCHLMVEDPEHHFEQFAEAGADSVTFHYEVAPDPPATAEKARALGLRAGLAFNPATAPRDVAERAEGFDLVLCMSIWPGYSGQEFLPESPERVRELRSFLPPEIHVQVDGGIHGETIALARDAGADLFVAGSAVFDGKDPAAAFRRLAEAVA
ncbi:MAG TPA: ribulose-phosphate 3-epimerase [Gaiellaceae bacterium]